MKKTLLGILGAAVLLSMCVATAFAAGPGCGRQFVDADGDGVCDNAGAMCGYVDEDGDGVCDLCGAGRGGCPAGAGTAFVDEDGVCDNLGSGRGRGAGRGGLRGGCGFRGGRGR